MPLEWTHDRYGDCRVARLSVTLELRVTRPIGTQGRPPEPWQASVFGGTLKGRFDDPEAAQAAAELVAQRQLRVALAKFSGNPN